MLHTRPDYAITCQTGGKFHRMQAIFIIFFFFGGGGVLGYTFIIYGNPVKSILSTRKYRACSNLEWTPLNKRLCVCMEIMRFFSRTSPICWSNHIWTTIGREKVKSVLPSLPIDKHSSVFQALRIRFSW